jgi:hypothetical protein
MMASRHGIAWTALALAVCVSLLLSALFCAFPWSMVIPVRHG